MSLARVLAVGVVLVTGCAAGAASAKDRAELFRALHGQTAEVAVPPAGPGAWYGFRNGLQNQGVSALELRRLADAAPAGREPWAVQTQGVVWGTPVVDAQGNVYVGSADKSFQSIAPGGQVRWSFRLPDSADAVVDSAATLTRDGLVVVPGGDGALHALRTSDGHEQWTFEAHHFQARQAGAGDEAVVNSFEGNVTLGPDGELYAGSDNGWLYALTSDGHARWSFQTGMMIWSAVAFDPAGKWLCFGSLDRHLYVLDRATGKLIASYKAGAEFKGSPAVGADGRIYTGNSDYSLHCLELTKGLLDRPVIKERWSYATRGEIYSSPAVAQDRVVFGSHDGYLHCITTDGKLVWKYGIYARISASPLISKDGVVVAGAKNGKLYAVDLESGHRLWSFRTAPGTEKVNLDSSPALTPDGRLVVGSYDGRVMAIPAEFAPRHPGDPRCDLSPGSDVPAFGSDVPQTGATLRYQDHEGLLPAGPAGTVAPTALLTYRLIARQDGDLVPNASVAVVGMSVTADPPVDIQPLVATDGTALTLIPRGFWKPGTTYTVQVHGRWYTRSNPFIDLLKWWNLPRLDVTTRFTVGAGAPALPAAGPDGDLRFAIRNLYVAQPELLDTLIPAAMDGQAFVASVLASDASKLAMLVLPAFPRPEDVVIRAAPDRVFAIEGAHEGASVRLEGPLSISAMGGSMTFEPMRIFCRMDADGLADGQFHAQAPLWKIKGNGSAYHSLSWNAIEDLSDPRLRLQAVGTLKGVRIATGAAPATLAGLSWPDAKTAEVRLNVPAALSGEHLVTVALVDEAAVKITAHASVALPPTAGAVTLRVALPAATGVTPHVLLDGQPLRQP